ncbi:MAG: CPBP family intramembrane glutamic endopeptidase [Candidatus Heimdallarchaeota archaeon]
MDIWDFFFGEFGYILFFIFLIVILLFLVKFIGKYPIPFQLSEKPKKEIKEIIFLWGIVFLYFSVSIFLLSPIFIQLIGDSFYIGVLLNTIFILIIPLAFVIYVNKWNKADFGLTNKIESPSIAIFSIISYLFLGIYCFFRLEQSEFYWYVLIILFYSNAFLEEFFFRAILQSKLERALGQKKAVIYQGILFMLIHIPGNVIRFVNDGNLIWFFWNFTFQFVHGINYGIIFMKTRNIWPSVICHYLTNWTGRTILLFF